MESCIRLWDRYYQSKIVPANETVRPRIEYVLDAVDGGALGEFIPRGYGIGRSRGRW